MSPQFRAWLVLCLGLSLMFIVAGCNSSSSSGVTAGTLVVIANRTGTVSVFGYNATTGALTAAPQSPYTTGGAPSSVVIAPQNNFVFTANQTTNNISAFRINGDGSLSAVTGAPFTSQGNGPAAIALSSDGKFAYVANAVDSTVSTYAVSNGTLSAQGVAQPTGSGPVALAMDPKGRFLYTANVSGSSVTGFKVDSGSGALTLIGTTAVGAGGEPLGITEDPAGAVLFVADFKQSVFSFAIDQNAGTLTLVHNVLGGTGPAGVSVDPGGAFLFTANETSADVSSFKIIAGGALSDIGQVPTSGATPVAVAATPQGKLVYVTNSGSGTVSGFIYDTNGNLTAIANQSFPVSSGGSPSSIAISH